MDKENTSTAKDESTKIKYQPSDIESTAVYQCPICGRAMNSNREMGGICLFYSLGGDRMTIDEAIKHCEEVVENNEQFASGKWIGSEGEANRQECLQSAADHRQLAEWLTELKERREREAIKG